MAKRNLTEDLSFKCSNCQVSCLKPQIFSCKACEESEICEFCIVPHMRKKHDVCDMSGYAPGVCSEHSAIGIYFCKDCKLVLCAACFSKHRNHAYSSVSEEAGGIRREIHEAIAAHEASAKPILKQKLKLDELICEQRELKGNENLPFGKEECKNLICGIIDEVHSEYKREHEQWLSDTLASLEAVSRVSGKSDTCLKNLRSYLVNSDGVLVSQYTGASANLKSAMKNVVGQAQKLCISSDGIQVSRRSSDVRANIREVVLWNFPQLAPSRRHIVSLLSYPGVDGSLKFCAFREECLFWRQDSKNIKRLNSRLFSGVSDFEIAASALSVVFSEDQSIAVLSSNDTLSLYRSISEPYKGVTLKFGSSVNRIISVYPKRDLSRVVSVLAASEDRITLYQSSQNGYYAYPWTLKRIEDVCKLSGDMICSKFHSYSTEKYVLGVLYERRLAIVACSSVKTQRTFDCQSVGAISDFCWLKGHETGSPSHVIFVGDSNRLTVCELGKDSAIPKRNINLSHKSVIKQIEHTSNAHKVTIIVFFKDGKLLNLSEEMLW